MIPVSRSRRTGLIWMLAQVFVVGLMCSSTSTLADTIPAPLKLNGQTGKFNLRGVPRFLVREELSDTGQIATRRGWFPALE